MAAESASLFLHGLSFFGRFILLFSFLELFLDVFSFRNYLFEVLDGTEHLDAKDVLGTESQRKHLANPILSFLRRHVWIDALDHECVHLDELIHYLLIGLEFKSCHFIAKVVHEEIAQDGAEDRHN